ncbi:MAG: plasmid recombination protein [Oscillospiraceae bacterium]|nr:plasmid recombination protein [Oscillospiraceae bacterium]
MSKNYAVARVQQYTKASIGKSERHIERKNQNYENMNVDLSQTPRNVHFQSCGDLTYNATLDKMIEEGTVSLRGLKPDAKLFDEMIFDVNSAYFEEHGGYDYACRFYEEVFRFAQKEYGPENILSAVMHADELNSALTEKLGYPVYHYHLHVVALPVVEKEVRYSKRCKDPELVGKVKEVIHQVSHSKKWASQKVTDENGKSHIIKSYSLLQDRFFEHMRDAGFEDFERGERGSTAQHLSVTEFKVKQEQQRLADITDEKLAAIDALDRLAEEEIQKQEALTKLEQQAKKAEKKLDAVVPVVQDAETFARNNISYFEDLIPEAGALESAKSYREHKIMPLVQKLKEKFLGLYRTILDLKKRLESLQKSLSKAERDRDHYKSKFEQEQEKTALLQEDAADLSRVKRALGPDKINSVIAFERERDAARKAEQAELERQRKLARKRHERDAR